MDEADRGARARAPFYTAKLVAQKGISCILSPTGTVTHTSQFETSTIIDIAKSSWKIKHANENKKCWLRPSNPAQNKN